MDPFDSTFSFDRSFKNSHKAPEPIFQYCHGQKYHTFYMIYLYRNITMFYYGVLEYRSHSPKRI